MDADIFKGKIVIVGIGNTLRSDDGFGPALIARLKDKVNPVRECGKKSTQGFSNGVKALCIDAGSAPENYLGKIVRENPGTILIVDVVCLGLSAGEHRILKKQDLLNSGLGTHNIPLPMFIEYLEHHTAADIYMLGVQPQSLALGGEMSDQVKKALSEVEGFLLKILGRNLQETNPCTKHI